MEVYMDLKTFQKRLTKSEKNVKQLQSFIAEASKAANAVRKKKKSAIKSCSRQIEKYYNKLEKKLNRACIKEINDLKSDVTANSEEMEKQLKAVISEVNDSAKLADEKTAQQIEKDLTDFAADVDTAKENIQNALDVVKSCDIDSLLLKAQMNVNAAEERIDGDLAKKDQAAQEALLAQLLDYADACQELIAVIALEAGQVILDSSINPDQI